MDGRNSKLGMGGRVGHGKLHLKHRMVASSSTIYTRVRSATSGALVHHSTQIQIHHQGLDVWVTDIRRVRLAERKPTHLLYKRRTLPGPPSWLESSATRPSSSCCSRTIQLQIISGAMASTHSLGGINGPRVNAKATVITHIQPNAPHHWTSRRVCSRHLLTPSRRWERPHNLPELCNRQAPAALTLRRDKSYPATSHRSDGHYQQAWQKKLMNPEKTDIAWPSHLPNDTVSVC